MAAYVNHLASPAQARTADECARLVRDRRKALEQQRSELRAQKTAELKRQLDAAAAASQRRGAEKAAAA